MSHKSQKNRNIFLIRVGFHKWKITGGLVGLIAVSIYFYFASAGWSIFSFEFLAWSAGLCLFGILIGSIADMTYVGNPKPSFDPGASDPKFAHDKASTNDGVDLGGGD